MLPLPLGPSEHEKSDADPIGVNHNIVSADHHVPHDGDASRAIELLDEQASSKPWFSILSFRACATAGFSSEMVSMIARRSSRAVCRHSGMSSGRALFVDQSLSVIHDLAMRR
jgi:hypothetical protein